MYTTHSLRLFLTKFSCSGCHDKARFDMPKEPLINRQATAWLQSLITEVRLNHFQKNYKPTRLLKVKSVKRSDLDLCEKSHNIFRSYA